MTEPNFGFTDVVLNSDRFYASFLDAQHFEHPGELAWMLWQPPASVVNMDEWFEVHRSSGAAKVPRASSFAMIVMLTSLRMGDGAQFISGARSAFLSVIENVNAGNLEALEGSMHRSTYNYVKGWMNYMKKHGYTWKHTVEEVISVTPSGASIVSTWGRANKKSEDEEEDSEEETGRDKEEREEEEEDGEEAEDADAERPALQYHDDPHSSVIGSFRDQLQNVSTFSWANITAREKFEILDSKGSIVLSSPSKVCHHVWKFGTTSKIPGRRFDDLVQKYKGKELPKRLQEQWQFKLYDIDNQVILRASEICSQEKVFLSADAPKYEAWQMTRAF